MTRSFTASELRAAAIVATEHQAVIRIERDGAVVEVKPVDLDADKTQADKLDLMDLKRRG